MRYNSVEVSVKERPCLVNHLFYLYQCIYRVYICCRFTSNRRLERVDKDEVQRKQLRLIFYMYCQSSLRFPTTLRNGSNCCIELITLGWKTVFDILHVKQTFTTTTRVILQAMCSFNVFSLSVLGECYKKVLNFKRVEFRKFRVIRGSCIIKGILLKFCGYWVCSAAWNTKNVLHR